MTDPDDMSGTKCFAEGCGPQGNIDINTRIIGTKKACTITEDEEGTQEVNLTNAKRYAVDVDLQFKSQNRGVNFQSGGDCSDCVERTITLNPGQIGAPGKYKYSVTVSQNDGNDLTEETLSVSTEYDYRKSIVGKQTGPDAHPRVNLE